MSNNRDIATVPPLRTSEKLGFLTFSTASNVVYQFKSLYYLFFLTNVLKIDVLIAGTILTIGTIWDAVNDPLVGFWAVNHKFKNGEKCRPFALWCSVPWAATVVLLFSDFGASERMNVIIALIVYLIFELFNTFVAIPYNSMGSLATDRDSDRRSINVFRNLGGCFGSGIGAVACLPLLKLFGGLDASGNLIEGKSERGFLLTATVMGLVCIIGSLAHYFTTKERVKQISDNEEKLKAGEVARMLLGNKSWVLNMLYIICYGVVNVLIMTCVTYYATYVLGSTGAATMILAAYLVVAVIASFLVPPIDRRLGRKKTMMLGCAVFLIGAIPFLINPFNPIAIYINAAGVAVSLTIAFVMFNTNRNNIADLIEWQGGRRIDSMVSTGDNLASKLATAGATQLIALSLNRAGLDANLAATAQPASVTTTITLLLGWVPVIVVALMFVVACFTRIDKDMAAMHAEKAAQT